eukprot:527215_1
MLGSVSNTSVKQKKVKPLGYCTKHIFKCEHQRYLCPDCHEVNNQGYLIKIPKYITDSKKPCTWCDKTEGSYPKHNKRYHCSKSKHKIGWKKTTQFIIAPSRNQINVIIKSKTSTNSNNTIQSSNNPIQSNNNIHNNRKRKYSSLSNTHNLNNDNQTPHKRHRMTNIIE